jgi:hypothetical protein
MLNTSKSQCSTHGWLDSLAISMSVICAVHCLLTPILVVLFPIITTTFWVHHNFHLWMLLFVLPTTSFAVFLGCRKHRDKFVIGLSSVGLGCLFVVSLYESFFHMSHVFQHGVECAQCSQGSFKDHLTMTTFTNILGGILLASAHVRNYCLCRRLKCEHD